jgi:hypothetical protein
MRTSSSKEVDVPMLQGQSSIPKKSMALAKHSKSPQAGSLTDVAVAAKQTEKNWL